MASRQRSTAKQIHHFQEALTRLALVRNGVPQKQIYWGRKLGDEAGAAGSGIDTDLIVAADPERPRQVIQVRHSSSSKEQEKKFWRQIHELTAVKAACSPAPVTVSVIFDDAGKEGLFKAEAAAFDAVLRLPSRMYGRVLLDWCRTLTELRLGAGPGIQSTRKHQAYLTLDQMTTPGNPAYEAELHEAVDAYRKDLGRLPAAGKSETDKPLAKHP